MLKKGFTLAEVLMTLAIIGVVAAITLPSLNYNIGNQALEKQTVKFYSQLHDGVMMGIADSGSGFDFNESFIRKNFNVVTICDSSDTRKNCLGSNLSKDGATYRTLKNGTTINVTDVFPTSKTIYALADGAIFTVDEGNTSIVTFDVNGSNAPNVYGRDLWKITVFPDGSIDDANMTPEMRQTGSSTEIQTELTKAYNNCKNGVLDGSVAHSGGYDHGQGGTVQVSSCFGHFMRNKFKFDY